LRPSGLCRMLAAMPRKPRIAPGGLAYHVMNRRTARLRLFDDDGDYAAFLRGHGTGTQLVDC
jgi:hypothetical protein